MKTNSFEMFRFRSCPWSVCNGGATATGDRTYKEPEKATPPTAIGPTDCYNLEIPECRAPGHSPLRSPGVAVRRLIIALAGNQPIHAPLRREEPSKTISPREQWPFPIGLYPSPGSKGFSTVGYKSESARARVIIMLLLRSIIST